MSKTKETAVIVHSDMHYGRKTISYNPDVFVRRMKDLRDSIAKIKYLLNSEYDFDKLVIFQLGDANDGTDIYKTQPHHQAITNVEAQAYELSQIYVDHLTDLGDIFPRIEIEAVPGNHGRAGRFAHEGANWDIVTYRYTQMQLANTNIFLHMNPIDNPFIRQVGIRGWNYLLYHGHEIKSWGGIPWYGILLRLARWGMTNKYGNTDVAVMGHFHSFGQWQFNKMLAMMSGTMVTDDDWALQSLGWESTAKWWMFGVNDKRPITWQYGLELAKSSDRADGLIIPNY